MRRGDVFGHTPNRQSQYQENPVVTMGSGGARRGIPQFASPVSDSRGGQEARRGEHYSRSVFPPFPKARHGQVPEEHESGQTAPHRRGRRGPVVSTLAFSEVAPI